MVERIKGFHAELELRSCCIRGQIEVLKKSHIEIVALRKNLGKASFCGGLRFCESGYTRFHEGERLDEGVGLARIQGLPG